MLDELLKFNETSVPPVCSRFGDSVPTPLAPVKLLAVTNIACSARVLAPVAVATVWVEWAL